MKIRAKNGFNLIIKDIGLTLKSEKREWIEISEKDYNSSSDIKSFSDFIEIYDSKKESKDLMDESKNKKVENKKETIFVKDGRTYENPSDTFVKYEYDIVEISKEDEKEIIEEEKEIKEKEIIEEEKIELNNKVEKQHKGKKQKSDKKNNNIVEKSKNIDIT